MRIVLIVLALLAAGYLVVQERGARAAADIQTQSLKPTGTPSPRELATASKQLQTAQHWNPDTAPALNLGVLQGRAHDYRAAGATFARITRKEPENAQAWLYLSLVAQRYDSDLAATARARARALEPPVPPAR